MLWMLWMPHSRAHFVCQNDFWANICANVLRNPYPATGRYVPVQFSKFYHWKYSCEVFLLCMMMMIGQMMKLRKQARSIWQRGALEWWSGASALSADGYWTNTILSGSPSWFLPSGLPSLKWTNTILSGWFWNVRGVMWWNYGSNLDPACLLVINENKVGDDYFTLTLVRCHKLCFRANLFWQDYMMIVWTMFLEHGGMVQ